MTVYVTGSGPKYVTGTVVGLGSRIPATGGFVGERKNKLQLACP